MSSSQKGVETEIKLAVESTARAKRLLKSAGFRVSKRRTLETNVVFDSPGRKLRSSGRLLRLRRSSGQWLLTFKGPSTPGRHKSRPEVETILADGEAAAGIMQGLGFSPTYRYEKFRTEFSIPGEPGIVLLDEMPMGIYLELEGPPRWIDRTARTLGFKPEHYIKSSYPSLHTRHLRSLGKGPADMKFRKGPA